MAHQWFRCNLLQSDFPLLTDLFGESCVVQIAGEQAQQNDAEIFYCENVIPTSAGYQTAGFIDRNINGAPPVGLHGSIHSAYNFSAQLAAGTSLQRMVLAASDTDSTGLYVFNTLTVSWGWVTLPGAPVVGTNRQISSAIVNGQSYVCPALQGLYHFTGGTNLFTADATTGVTATNIKGVCGSNGLLIAWFAGNTILWSSNQNPLDFTPSLITGAGGGSIGEVKGDITYCAPVSGGFIIYATQNIVQAIYTGNVSFPFKFQEISGSGGTFDNGQIAFHDNADNQFAFTDKGLQAIQIGTAVSNILPKITEFLVAGYYETFDPATGLFTKIATSLLYPTNHLNVLINFIASRFMTISYGWSNPIGLVNQYDYALILDTETGRMGRIKFTHVDIVDFDISGQGNINPLARIAFISRQGAFQTIDMGLNQPGDASNVFNGLIVIGKYQMQRNRGVYSQRVKLECSYVDGIVTNVSCSTMPTLDGKNFQAPVAMTELNTPSEANPLKVYAQRRYGLNMSYLIQGQFNLSSMQVDMVLGAQDMRYT